MSCVLRFRGNRLILAMAFSVGMTCATGAMARGQMREVVRQAISHAKGPLEQLSRLGDGKVQIKALCAVAGLACIVNFSAPAAADFSGLQSDASLSKSRGMSSIFAKGTGYEKSLADESGFEGSWWLGYGIYKDDGGNLGAARIGVNGKHPNFSLYFTASERHHPDMTDGFDGIGLKVRTFGGGSGMLIKNREGEPSFGYGSVDLFTSDKLSILDFQAYLGHYSKGPFQVAAGGMEYMDKELDAVEGADSVRGVYASLYRASYSNTYTTPQGIDITFKASSVLGLGDMGVVELARFWQGEMNEFAGNADLDPAAYHKGSASIGLVSQGWAGSTEHRW